ncbi:polysaccharide deacetylase family protein [bacterium]|nr:polysaccharide deacetylase family protein [bacterium]
MVSAKKISFEARNAIKAFVACEINQDDQTGPDSTLLDSELQQTFQGMYDNHEVWEVDRRLELILDFLASVSASADDIVAFRQYTQKQIHGYIRKMCDCNEEELTELKMKPGHLQDTLEDRVTDRRLRIIQNYLAIINRLDQLYPPYVSDRETVPVKVQDTVQAEPGQIVQPCIQPEIESVYIPPVRPKQGPIGLHPILKWGLAVIIPIGVGIIGLGVMPKTSEQASLHNDRPDTLASVSTSSKLDYSQKRIIPTPGQNVILQKESGLDPKLHPLELTPRAERSLTPQPTPQIVVEPAQPAEKSSTAEPLRRIIDSDLTLHANIPLNLIRGNPGYKSISLTFDGHSQRQDTVAILEILARYKITCTFFLTGGFIEEYPEETKMIVAAGHEVGNHLYSHPHLYDIDEAKFKTELIKADQAFYKLCGKHMAPYWRAPYGEYVPKLARIARELGFVHIHWTHGTTRRQSLDTIDWVEDPDSKLFSSSDEIVRHILSSDYKAGGIILLHVGARTIDPPYKKFPDLIQGLRDQGYSIIPITEMLKQLKS